MDVKGHGGSTRTLNLRADQSTTGADGGGFDIDGGSQNVIVQYCSSFNNSGPGYMHCAYPDSRPSRDNVIRYCISQSDGRKTSRNEGAFHFVTWGEGLSNCHIYAPDRACARIFHHCDQQTT
jgi:hypothetical protein